MEEPRVGENPSDTAVSAERSPGNPRPEPLGMRTSTGRFESFPHHPAHLPGRLWSLPPVVGLIDLVRSVWRRRRNPFYAFLLRRFWGIRPWLKVFCLVVLFTLAVVPIEILRYTGYQRALGLSGPSGGYPLSGLFRVTAVVLPPFLSDPSFYVAVLFAWKIRRFRRDSSFNAELAVLPDWKPSVVRSVAVQVFGVGLLLAFFHGSGLHLLNILRSGFRAVMFPPGTSFLRYPGYLLGLWNFPPTSQDIVRLLFLARLKWFCETFIALALYLIVMLRARSFPRLIVLVVVAGYAIEFYSSLVNAFSSTGGRLWGDTMGTGWGTMLVAYSISVAIHLLVIGTIWYSVCRWARRTEDPRVRDG